MEKEARDIMDAKLRGWDAATFRTASGDPTLRSTVVALTILESAPEWARLRQRVERLTLFVPALRMRPLFGALGMSAPRLAVGAHAHLARQDQAARAGAD